MRAGTGGTLLLAAWLLLSAAVSAAGAGTSHGDAPDKARFSFTFQQVGNDCRFKGSFNVLVGAQTAWNVLTDFKNRSKFVSNVNCHVRQKDGDGLWVDLTVGGGFLFIREEVKGLLRVQEVPMKSLSFEEISHKNFGHYGGSWTLQPDSSDGSMKVSFQLDAEINRFTPSFVTPDLLRQTSEDFMTQMRREMVRRQSALKAGGQE